MKIQNFLNEFKNIPEIVAVYSQIEQVKITFSSSGIKNWGEVKGTTVTYLFIFLNICILLKYSWPTVFQVHSKVIQLYIYMYIIF